MPAFTFEKITPPDQPGSSSDNVESKPPPRGAIIRLLDRFVESAVKRGTPERAAPSRSPGKPTA